MRHLIAILLTALLAACQTGPYPVDSPFYEIPVGSRLILKRPLEFPPDTVSITFGQGPSASYWSGADDTCTFQLYRKSDQAQRVEPDSFEIVKVSRSSNRFASAPAPTGWVRVGIGAGAGGGPSRYFYETNLFLRSEKQPNVYLMACEHVWWTSDSVFRARHMTVAEIRAILGDTFSLELAGP